MASKDGNPEELRILLVGRTGSGKSATGNAILGKGAFTIRRSQVPETLTCQTERGEFEATPVVVVDTPSTMVMNVIEMSKCISYCAPGPHVLVVVISLNQSTDVDQYVKALKWMFGEEVLRYIIVLFTHGDELADEVSKEELINQNPVPYGVGHHVFNIRDEHPSQVRELLEKINRMVQRNGGSYCIKVQDWKHKCLYLLASAVTIGCSIGAANGGTGGGVLLTVEGSVVGAFASAVGGSRAVAVSIIGAAVLGLAVAIGDGVGTGIEFALTATAAIAVGAGANGAAFKGFAFMVHFCVLVGIFGGAAVGTGVPCAVGAITARVHLVSAYFAALAGVFVVVLALIFILLVSDTPISKMFGCAIVAGVSAGAAFGAAAGILGASGFAAGAVISVACQAVTWWLNKT